MSFLGAGSLKGLKGGFGANFSLDEANVSGQGNGFRTGGYVKKTGKSLVHSGEYVLPVGVKPTVAQKKKVKVIKEKAKGKKN